MPPRDARTGRFVSSRRPLTQTATLKKGLSHSAHEARSGGACGCLRAAINSAFVTAPPTPPPPAKEKANESTRTMEDADNDRDFDADYERRPAEARSGGGASSAKQRRLLPHRKTGKPRPRKRLLPASAASLTAAALGHEIASPRGGSFFNFLRLPRSGGVGGSAASAAAAANPYRKMLSAFDDALDSKIASRRGGSAARDQKRQFEFAIGDVAFAVEPSNTAVKNTDVRNAGCGCASDRAGDAADYDYEQFRDDATERHILKDGGDESYDPWAWW